MKAIALTLRNYIEAQNWLKITKRSYFVKYLMKNSYFPIAAEVGIIALTIEVINDTIEISSL